MEDFKDYRQVADDAHDRCEKAKAQSHQHSADLEEMQQVASEARELLQQGQARQRKRQNA